MQLNYIGHRSIIANGVRLLEKAEFYEAWTIQDRDAV
jgi:hypothetical protein